MRPAFTLLLAAALVAPLAAQNARTTTLVGNAAQNATDVATSSDADLSVVVYEDDADGSIRLVRADGRGTSWSLPLRVDDASSAAQKWVFPTSVAVVGSKVYVAWTDDRNKPPAGIGRDVYFNYSTDGGLTFLPADIKIDKGLPSGGNDVKSIRMAVDPGVPSNPNDDLVAIAMLVEDDLAPGKPEWAMMNYSANGGAGFQVVALSLSGHIGIGDVDEYDIDVEGNRIYAAFIDDFLLPGGADDCWFSCFDVTAGFYVYLDVPMSVFTAGAFDADDGVAIDVRNGVAAVVWMRVATGGPFGHELLANVSADGGLTWTGELPMGSYVPGIDDVDVPDVAITQNGNIIVAWQDDRVAPSEVYATVSTDTGTTWLPDALVASASLDVELYLLAPEDLPILVWGAPPSQPQFYEAAISTDAGLSWVQPLAVSTNTGDVDRVRVAWNPLYQNFVMAWLADDLNPSTAFNDVYAGGFRPQTLIPVGDFSVAGNTVSFQVAHWPHSDRGSAFGVVASAGLGSLVLGDGRDLGLVNDSTFNSSLSYVQKGILQGTIDALGAGSTASFGVPALPATVYAVGVSFQNKSTVYAFTDPVQIL